MSDRPFDEEAGNIWDRLRRRKMAQWGIAYAAGAWGLLQGIGFVADAFAWPATAKQIATLALLTGLPVVLVLAWYHGEKGHQRVTASELAILTLLFLTGGGVFWIYDRHSETMPPTVQAPRTAPTPTAVESRPSIAVLPLENRSRLADDAFFVDGVYDDILTQLSKIGAMRVIARTSVEQFRDTRLTTREIGELLGVANVLEGGVQRAGDRVRVHVQLIDASTDSQLWAESYDRELTVANMFAIQSEVAAAIAAALNTTLAPVEQVRAKAAPTQDLAAWEAYQLGRQRMATRTSADLAEAERFFREAIERDPGFALAYVGLADALLMQIAYSGVGPESTVGTAEQALTKALELDPNLAEAWASSGLIARQRRQYERAESMLRRAIELNPNHATARHWYSVLLRDLGRADEALVQIERAAELDPLSALISLNLGERLVAKGRFDEAEASFRRAIKIDPSGPLPYVDLALLQAYALGRFTEAVPLAQKATELDVGGIGPSAMLARMYYDLGDDRRFVDQTAEAEKQWPDDSSVQLSLSLIRLMHGDAESATQHARRSLDADPRNPVALMILRDADLRAGRSDAALARYKTAYPELFVRGKPRVDGSNYWIAIDLAVIARWRGDSEMADALLAGAERAIQTVPRLGDRGYWISDVQIHALRGETDRALNALRAAELAGWRGPRWRYGRDYDLSLATVRDAPEFRAVFSGIERDMAQQRAELAKRPKDEPPHPKVPSR